jgi:uncharacterized membrane protein YidH (DUF202 family)
MLLNRRSVSGLIRRRIGIALLGKHPTGWEVHGSYFGKTVSISRFHEVERCMMAFGSVLTLLAAWRCHGINQAIDRGEFQADRGLVIMVTISVALLAVVMIAHLLLTGNRF